MSTLHLFSSNPTGSELSLDARKYRLESLPCRLIIKQDFHKKTWEWYLTQGARDDRTKYETRDLALDAAERWMQTRLSPSQWEAMNKQS